MERDSEKTYRRKPIGGRPPMELCRVLQAIFYVLRTGTLRKALPKEYGSSSSVHRYFRYWCEKGFFRDLGRWPYDEVQGIEW
ncbi:MAG: transposase, partial [Treponema sp.]|nr:transposase [Treponema sp.]